MHNITSDRHVHLHASLFDLLLSECALSAHVCYICATVICLPDCFYGNIDMCVIISKGKDVIVQSVLQCILLCFYVSQIHFQKFK